MTSLRDHDLAVLGLAGGASADDITKAYRARVRELHPDLGGPDGEDDHERLSRLAESRRRLLLEDLGPDSTARSEARPPGRSERDIDPAASRRTVRRTARLFALTAIVVTVVVLLFTLLALVESG